MFIWGQFTWTKCLISSLRGINTAHVLSLCSGWLSPAFCRRANVVWWNMLKGAAQMDEWSSCCRDQRLMTQLSHFIYFSLWFCFCSFSSFLSCLAIPAAQDDRIHVCVCMCVCLVKWISEYTCLCELVFLCISLCVCLYKVCPFLCMCLHAAVWERICVCVCVWSDCVSFAPCLGTAIDFLPL